METLALLLILFSALMHALWNLMVKQSHDKTIFIWWMFLCSWLLMNLLMISLDLFPVLTPRLIALAALAAFCFVLYHWLGGFAYRQGDLSVTYPLAQTAMFYVPIWGVLFLGEQLSSLGILGIGLIALGAYCIQLRGLRLRDVIYPFTQLGNPSVQAALLAGLVYSIGVIIDKAGVDGYSPFGFTYVLVFFMIVYMTLNLLRPRYRGRILGGRQESPWLLIWSGPVILASFLSFRYGLVLAPVSYAVPVRQISLLIGVLIGLLFLGESFGRIRLTSVGLILAGVFCVWQG
ncbi:EamA family transporter [Pelovirga terrestris]|uniref:EamA family transporter n=1 Tax=Pelovirga terrestris TaxID=2771352 RepID=A0A8J6QP38_9BACT|nr:EamA family transporter [Pelovirga terrestris]MBD1400091.1 EamA family transporter [Pelovirga terrestris]